MTYRVLIADDEAPIRKQIARVCQGLGWEVEMADDGNKALELLSQSSHQVFVFDMKMPGPSGLELARRVPEFEEAAAVLIITGYADVTSAVEAMKEGVFDFVEKPVDMDVLKDLLIRAANYHEGCLRSLQARRERDEILKDTEQANERFRAMMELNRDAILFVEAKTGRIIDCNATACELLGQSRQELLEKDFTETDVETGYASWEELSQRVRAMQNVVVEGKQRTVNGAIIPVELSLSFTCLESREYITVVGRNVTERKRLEEELQKRSHALDDRVRELNCLHSVSKITEQSDADLDTIIERIVERIPSAFRDPETIAARVVLEDRVFETSGQGSKSWIFVEDIIAFGKRTGTLEICLLRETQGSQDAFRRAKESGVFCIVAESIGRIVQRHQTEQALEETEKRASMDVSKLRSMIEGMEEGVVLADENNTVTEVNDWFLDVVRMPREMVLGADLRTLHPEHVCEKVKSAIDDLRQGKYTRKIVVNREFMGHDVSIRIQPIFHDNVYQGVILNVIDIGDVVRERTKAEEANQSKSEILSKVTLEMRTLLHGITEMTKLLSDSDLDEERSLFVETIEDCANSASSLVNEIQDLSRIEQRALERESSG